MILSESSTFLSKRFLFWQPFFQSDMGFFYCFSFFPVHIPFFVSAFHEIIKITLHSKIP